MTEFELEGIIGDLELGLSEMFPDASIINYVKEVDGTIVVEIGTPNNDVVEIEEELASKSTELDSDYDYEFIFVVRDDNGDDDDNVE